MFGEFDPTTRTIENFHGQALESLGKMKESVEEDKLEEVSNKSQRFRLTVISRPRLMALDIAL